MTTNVDSHLHNAGGTENNDGPEREGDAPKRALRGAAGGVYIGPARIDAGDSNTAHATGAAPGGVDGSTGYRKANSYFADGDATGGGQGGGTAVVRPTGRTFYSGDGVQGGSTPGRPIASGTDHLMTGNFDKRSSIAGDGGVTVRLPSTLAADLDIHTGDGSVKVDLPFAAALQDKRNVRGKLNGGGLALSIRTGDGSVRVGRI